MKQPEVKQEVKRLRSRNADETLMFPGDVIFTWLRVAHMPWVLIGIHAKPEESV